MKSVKRLLVFSLTIVGFLLAGTAANATPLLTINLSQGYQGGGTGDTLDFSATIINNTGGTLYLNGDNFSLASPLVLDDSPYLTGYPLSLGAGDTYTGLLFTIYIPSGTPVGMNEGYFEIDGGTNDSAGDYLGSTNFDVYVTPEPSSLSLLGMGLLTGLLMFGGTLRRRQLGRS